MSANNSDVGETMAVARTRSLSDIYFNEHQRPDLLAAAEHLDGLEGDDSVQRAVAAVLARRRRAQLAKRGIMIGAWKCPCFLREGRGRVHKKRHGEDHLIRRCYALGEHPRGWYRGKELVAITYEPYNGHSATGVGELAQSVATDELAVSVCACCAVHFPGMSTAVVITRAEEQHSHL
ncbi:hypothetical protein GCM10009642_38590 [Nocardiopsis metallicus]